MSDPRKRKRSNGGNSGGENHHGGGNSNSNSNNMSTDDAALENKKKKMHKKMVKYLAKIWQLENASVFHGSLGLVGKVLDQKTKYYQGTSLKHAWQAFATDLGSVYTTHIKSKSKHAKVAKDHLEQVKTMLSEKDSSLGQMAFAAPPNTLSAETVESNRKRSNSTGPGSDNEGSARKKARDGSSGGGIKTNRNPELAEREVRAMEQLKEFITEHGGEASDLLDGFHVRVTKKKGQKLAGQAKYDINYFNASNRRFRSMLEVGRFFHLIHEHSHHAPSRSTKSRSTSGGGRGGNALTKEQQAEKKKIRRDLDKLRKALKRATADLDEFAEKQQEEQEQLFVVQQKQQQQQEEAAAAALEASNTTAIEPTQRRSTTPRVPITRRTCAATRLCDVTWFPGVAQPFLPDVLQAWDFLCTFQRDLSLQPIDLPDFCAALNYQPPDAAQTDDSSRAAPVYLVEAHLALLKLILQDKMCEDWWWSTVETDEIAAATTTAPTQTSAAAGAATTTTSTPEKSKAEDDENGDRYAPLIKIDMALLLAQNEDTLITTSWVRSLDGIEDKRGKAGKDSIKAALKLTRNKWVAAYLRKAMGLFRSVSPQATRRAVAWLVHRVTTARPDLADGNVDSADVYDQRAKVVEETMVEMEQLPDSVPTVTDEDAVSEEEEEEESDEEDSDDEEEDDDEVNKLDGQSGTDDKKPASSVPPKPLPTLVDMLLPNEQPSDKADYINPFTWAQMAGASVLRILHRKKWIWNEVDDILRANQDLTPLTVPQRREREQNVASRVLTECYFDPDDPNTQGEKDFVERAIYHLCSGNHYLDLTFRQRLCILRLLIEAAYDSYRLYDIIAENHNQRTNAMRALELEKKKAKKEAKEKAQSDEAAAREKLAEEARQNFLDSKREEIRRLNELSKEMSEEMIESLTDEDILDFDEDTKADFEALPTPENFTKAQVSAMVERMHEEAAFDTDALKVLTLDELLERERQTLEEMEGQLAGFGGEEALNDSSLDRETIRAIEALQKEIDKLKTQAERLPLAREKAIEQLKDAMQDGTIKVLRSAVTAAKKAKLTGADDETGGAWALDLLRDAALELENAKQNKKLIDAQKDSVAKRNKCFIRTEPVGRDRYGNRFWTFAFEEDGNIWAEAEYSLKEEGEDDYQPPPGYANVVRDGHAIVVGAPDREEDFVDADEKMDREMCRTFCRKEYHSSGFSPRLVQHHWGCHTSEESLRKVIKSLDEKNDNEKLLKANLKESLEKVEKEATDQLEPQNVLVPEEETQIAEKPEEIKTEGDEEYFAQTKNEFGNANDVSVEKLDEITSALGAKVRVRIRVDGSKDSNIARYETGTVNGWTTKLEEREVPREPQSDSDYEEMHTEPKIEKVKVPLWRVWTELGNVVMLDGLELLESMSRHEKAQSNQSYFEHDASFLGYRNNMGKFAGKAADAPYASSPFSFAKFMVKKEAELYSKLKMRSYDENWGGKSGERASWTNKMKDYAFDTETVKQGLLTLENAFFQLTGEFEDYPTPTTDEAPDAVALLQDPATRVDIELESDKNTLGLWNSPASRAVYVEIVSKATTTGFLALALELLCRNTTKYLKKHGLMNLRSREVSAIEEDLPPRRTRRRNAWQEANHDDWFE